MAVGTTRKISAASARAHTRKSKPKAASLMSPSGMLKKLLLIGLVGILAWAYQGTKPPPPKICGSKGGPPITASRVQLRDGRYLAYQEYGVSKDLAKHKVVFVHGFGCSRHDVAAITATLSPELIESKGIYILSFDRPGYGESDPHPSRTVESLAYDIEDLADKLGLGSKFHVVGFSMGGQIVWSCLKYIPHRLAGAVLLAPVVNYWWSSIPSNLSKQAYEEQLPQDQWALRIAHHFPWLTYWWNTQKLFPHLSVIANVPKVLSTRDKHLFPGIFAIRKEFLSVPRQGEFESVHRDVMIGFGKWEFDPTELSDPFPDGDGSVHLWQGDEDLLVSVALQRHIVEKLPWVRYHELAGSGHMFPFDDGLADEVIRGLLH